MPLFSKEARMEGNGFEKRGRDMKYHLGEWKIMLLKKYSRIAVH